jgi:hypothetical protein
VGPGPNARIGIRATARRANDQMAHDLHETVNARFDNVRAADARKGV